MLGGYLTTWACPARAVVCPLKNVGKLDIQLILSVGVYYRNLCGILSNARLMYSGPQ